MAISFLPEASFGLRVLSLPASVCLYVCLCVHQSRACPRDNSSPVQARITKFGPKVYKTLVKILIVLGGGGNWPWPSRSNWTPKSKFSPFWASPCHNSPPIEVRISKFGTKMHLSTVQIRTNFWVDWNWSSIQFLISNPDQIELFMNINGILYWDQLVWKLGELKEFGGSELIQRTTIGTAPWHIDCFPCECFMVGSYWVCHSKKAFWVGGYDGIVGLAYLLFCAAYWSRLPRVFWRLSHSCFYWFSVHFRWFGFK